MGSEPRGVLITDATSYKAVVLARFLKRSYPRLTVHTCDTRRASSWLHTRFSDAHHLLPCGPSRPERFVEALAGLRERLAVDMLLPINSREMDVLMPARAALGPALSYWGSFEAYESLHRKDRLQALARSLGVRVPERFSTPAEIRAPAVAKPMAESSARGVRYLRTPDAVEAFRAERPDWAGILVQELIVGEGVGYSVFASDGRIRVGYGHRRLAEHPVSGGSSVYREGLDDPRMAEAAARLLAASGWSGFAMFEFKRTPAGDLVLLEVNPRVWGSIHQPLAAGVNMLEPLFGPAGLPIRGGVRTYLPPLVYGSLLAYALRGRIGPAVDFLAHLAENRADVSLPGDPRAWGGVLLRALPDHS